MSSNFQKDGETYDVVGTVSCGADNLDGVIVANSVALKKLGLEIRDDSSIVFDVMDYEYTNEGKYDYLLTSTPKEDGIVKLLNVSFGTYIYKMDDLVSRQVRFAIESTSFTRMILSLVGLVLVVLSAFLLASFINDSVRGKEKEIGILRSMGASRKDVIKTFSIEVLAISLPVALLGNILGWFLVFYGNASYSIKAFTLPLFHYSVLTIFMVIALTLIVSFLSAIWPIEKISRKNVVDAIKGE
jgi:ABC-type antimicrobial peptide transport system permease subunit